MLTMLDELFGRADLRAEIESLQAERDQLEARLEAESDRRKEAVRERQAAEERLNHLEDRIAGLEGELAEVQDDEEDVSFYRVETLSRQRMETVLDRLESIRFDSLEAYMASFVDEVPSEAAALLGDRAPLLDRASPCVFCADDTGLIRACLAPPHHPGEFERWDDGFVFERDCYVPSGEFTFALVRSDVFACGTYEGDERVDYTGFESNVMGNHSKGGFSQGRFERGRDEQVAAHLDRVNETLARRDTEALIVVGDHQVIKQLSIEVDAAAAIDATGELESALDDAFERFWRTRLYLP